MNETFLREVAARFDLEVLKRITSGDAKQHFATFELSGPAESVSRAWKDIRPMWRGGDYDRLTHVDNEEHPEYGKPFIECQSVWCEI